VDNGVLIPIILFVLITWYSQAAFIQKVSAGFQPATHKLPQVLYTL
jgi:hypothetical protein